MPDDLALLDSLKLWRAIPVTGMLHHHLQGLKALMLLNPGTTIEAIVLDTHDRTVPGGTGKPNDWPAVRAGLLSESSSYWKPHWRPRGGSRASMR